jgi:hypothetical protein
MRAIQDPADAAKYAVLVIRWHLPDPAYRIFLLGSRASGSAAERSDIDIGIEGPAPVPHPALAAIHDEREEAPTLFTIDVVDFRRLPDKIPQSRATAHRTVTKSQSPRADFTRAVTRLDEALALPKDPIVRDSAVRDFVLSHAGNSSKPISKSSARLVHLTPYLFSLGIPARGHRQRSVLDRPDGSVKLHRPHLERAACRLRLLSVSRSGGAAFEPSSRLRRAKVIRGRLNRARLAAPLLL